MKKILIITHGDLCKGYNSALEVITTQKDKVDVIGIHPEDNQEVITSKIDNYIKQNANNSIVIQLVVRHSSLFHLLQHTKMYI